MKPTTAVSHRPQTLKQAKKAYRKSGATVRLSASEQAIIERRAVLQERADRIKEREARRKANVKRKEERNEKEREARQRMGIPEPAKEGIHVGPSQLSLGKFMTVGDKRKLEEECDVHIRIDNEGSGVMELKRCQTSSLPRTPWRNPLSVISPNMSTPKTFSMGVLKTEPIKHPDLKVSQNASTYPQESATIKSEASSKQQKPRIFSQNFSKPVKNSKKHSEICSIPMGPPPVPPRKPSNAQHQQSTIKQKPPDIRQPNKPPEILEDDWDDFFVSSTQIARELSPPPVKSMPTANPPSRRLSPPPRKALLSPPAAPPLPLREEASNLLDQISTQDLDFSGDFTQALPQKTTRPPPTDDLLAQISTQDLDFSPDATQIPFPPLKSPPPQAIKPKSSPSSPPSSSGSFNDADLTSSDLEDFVQEFERTSTSRTTTPLPPPLQN